MNQAFRDYASSGSARIYDDLYFTAFCPAIFARPELTELAPTVQTPSQSLITVLAKRLTSQLNLQLYA